MNSRIGLLGGTFDPIHNGHLAIVRSAIQQLNLDKLLIVPAGNPWQKENITDKKHRLAMVKAATLGIDKVEVSEIEINKSGPTYTHETLEDLHKIYSESDFILLLGSDAVAGINTWKEPNKVKTLSRIYVIQRSGDFVQDWQFDHLKMPAINLSSTEIRERVSRNESIKELVPEVVEQYISTNSLYKN